MRGRAIPILAFLAALAALGAGRRAGADSLLTVASHTDGFQLQGARQSAKDAEAKTWISGEKLRHDEGHTSEIFRFDRGKLYVIDHAGKTYSELDLPIDLHKLVPPGNEQLVEQLVQMKKVEVSVHPTTESKRIRDWNARKVEVELRAAQGMTISTAIWISPEVPAYGAYNRMSAGLATLQGNLDWARQLEALEGFPVLEETVVRVMGTQFKSREELVTWKVVEAPPGTYEVPGGYTARPFDLTSGAEP